MNAAKVSEVALTPVKKSIVVGLSPQDAFRLFTEGIDSWWPLATHSVYHEDAETCTMEGREGGRLYEVHKDGRESLWGTVLSWEPPQRFVVTWHPGRDEATAQQLEVLFKAQEGGTRVDLIHRGWELLAEEGDTTRASYVPGWDFVLGHYLIQAGREGGDA